MKVCASEPYAVHRAGFPQAASRPTTGTTFWYPDLSPSPELVKLGHAASTEREWAAFKKRFRKEMSEPTARRTLDLLAALSHTTNLSVGCYCEDESHCHRSVLRELLAERGADIR